jgi:outer membrane protein assembly factor BamB
MKPTPAPAPRLVPLALALACTGAAPGADAWPQFRGPGEQGWSDATGMPLHWSEHEHVLWRTALPGEGWSSPVVGADAVWLTTALDGGHSLHAIKVDLATGRILIDTEVFTNEMVPVKHDRNSHASPTPVLDNDRVYVHFGAMGTACLASSDGHKIWENRQLKVNFEVGAGGSPILYHDRLLITCDGTDDQFEVALDAKTGKQLWRVERSAVERLKKVSPSSRKCFGTPLILHLDGRDESLSAAAERLYAYDPLSGNELWHVDYTGYSNAALPVADGKMLILPTGYDHSQIWGVTLGSLSGDVTATHVAWKVRLPGVSQASPLLIGGRAYILTDSGIMHCLDEGNGTVLWKERLGTDFAASPIFVDGRIYCFDTKGTATILAPGDAVSVLATNKLEDGCMASPAVVGKSLIVRTKSGLYRIE